MHGYIKHFEYYFSTKVVRGKYVNRGEDGKKGLKDNLQFNIFSRKIR